MAGIQARQLCAVRPELIEGEAHVGEVPPGGALEAVGVGAPLCTGRRGLSGESLQSVSMPCGPALHMLEAAFRIESAIDEQAHWASQMPGVLLELPSKTQDLSSCTCSCSRWCILGSRGQALQPMSCPEQATWCRRPSMSAHALLVLRQAGIRCRAASGIWIWKQDSSSLKQAKLMRHMPRL